MQPGESAAPCHGAVQHAEQRLKKPGAAVCVWQREETDGLSWSRLSGACSGVRAASRAAWGGRLAPAAVQRQRSLCGGDWATARQRFVSAYAPPVTHNGRRDCLHDYSTRQTACGSTRRDALCPPCVSGSQARPPLRWSFARRSLAPEDRLSFSSKGPPARPGDWPHANCQSKRRHCPNAAPGTAVVGSVPSVPLLSVLSLTLAKTPSLTGLFTRPPHRKR